MNKLDHEPWLDGKLVISAILKVTEKVAAARIANEIIRKLIAGELK